MKPCPERKHELAACAAHACEPSDALVAHLSECPACAEALAELTAAAALHSRTARELRTGSKSPRLKSWFLTAMAGRSPSTSLFRTLPKLAFAVSCAVLLALGALYWSKSPISRDNTPSVIIAINSWKTEGPAPTWQALRREVPAGNLPERAALNGGSVAHYRLKDSHLDLN